MSKTKLKDDVLRHIPGGVLLIARATRTRKTFTMIQLIGLALYRGMKPLVSATTKLPSPISPALSDITI
jgi:hypothetical protein